MAKNLVIVESPAKAKTIEGYLGKDFTVTSSYGHVRDLPKGDKAIDIKAGFKPTYEVTADKKEVIKNLKKLTKESDMVYLASDDDREGEAIAWHLKESLNLDDAKTRRIVFREITKNAILNSIQTPRGIDMDLVNAQQARRILDRLVGFELSPILWKKIKAGLSAGRVQSVAVRLIVDREREIEKFKAQSDYRVTAQFKPEKGKSFQAELSQRMKLEDDAKAFLERCIGASYAVENLEVKPAKKSPAPPFTTSTLQQEASRKLGFSVAQTMSIAQRLYESGKITYMRTDSVNLSDFAIENASKEITGAYGPEFLQVRKYKTKSESAQEAHEAIRPTDFAAHEAGEERNEQRLYELIWKRAIASQMAEAELERTVATIGISTTKEKFTAQGEIIKFEGFLKVYLESTDDEEDEDNKSILPPLAVNQALDMDKMLATERFSRPPARYSEAALVKKLEELGIGRPSTYAPTISTIQKRDYVVKESRDGRERSYQELSLNKDKVVVQTKQEITGTEKGKLFPTNIAMVVNDFLVEHFPNVIDFSFTAEVEKEFDEIANGKKVWEKMLGNFYEGFHSKVEITETIDRSEVGSSRDIGIDPKSGKKIIARLGRFGPIVQIGDSEGEEKPQFASLKKGQFIESISLEDALELFKLPREVGEWNGETLVAAAGRFGPYIKYDGKFYSLPKGEDPLSVSLERSIEIIKAKQEADANKLIKSFSENEEVQILNGQWGPYIKVGKKNVKIPKDKKAEDLTLTECLELAEAAPEKKGRFVKKKK